MGDKVASLSLLSRKRRVPPIPEPEQVGEFNDRLARLRSGAASRNVIWVGSDEAYALPGKGHVSPRTRRQRLLASIGLQIQRVVMLMLGFVSYAAWIIIRYRMSGLASPIADPDIAMGIHFAAAFFIATLVGRFFGVRFSALAFWKALGAAAGVTMFHDVVHLYPDLFTEVLPRWTQDVLAHTKPLSLYWRGEYYRAL